MLPAQRLAALFRRATSLPPTYATEGTYDANRDLVRILDAAHRLQACSQGTWLQLKGLVMQDLCLVHASHALSCFAILGGRGLLGHLESRKIQEQIGADGLLHTSDERAFGFLTSVRRSRTAIIPRLHAQVVSACRRSMRNEQTLSRYVSLVIDACGNEFVRHEDIHHTICTAIVAAEQPCDPSELPFLCYGLSRLTCPASRLALTKCVRGLNVAALSERDLLLALIAVSKAPTDETATVHDAIITTVLRRVTQESPSPRVARVMLWAIVRLGEAVSNRDDLHALCRELSCLLLFGEGSCWTTTFGGQPTFESLAENLVSTEVSGVRAILVALRLLPQFASDQDLKLLKRVIAAKLQRIVRSVHPGVLDDAAAVGVSIPVVDDLPGSGVSFDERLPSSEAHLHTATNWELVTAITKFRPGTAVPVRHAITAVDELIGRKGAAALSPTLSLKALLAVTRLRAALTAETATDSVRRDPGRFDKYVYRLALAVFRHFKDKDGLACAAALHCLRSWPSVILLPEVEAIAWDGILQDRRAVVLSVISSRRYFVSKPSYRVWRKFFEVDPGTLHVYRLVEAMEAARFYGMDISAFFYAASQALQGGLSSLNGAAICTLYRCLPLQDRTLQTGIRDVMRQRISTPQILTNDLAFDLLYESIRCGLTATDWRPVFERISEYNTEWDLEHAVVVFGAAVSAKIPGPAAANGWKISVRRMEKMTVMGGTVAHGDRITRIAGACLQAGGGAASLDAAFAKLKLCKISAVTMSDFAQQLIELPRRRTSASELVASKCDIEQARSLSANDLATMIRFFSKDSERAALGASTVAAALSILWTSLEGKLLRLTPTKAAGILATTPTPLTFTMFEFMFRHLQELDWPSLLATSKFMVANASFVKTPQWAALRAALSAASPGDAALQEALGSLPG